jgi:hypothetical protein
MNFACGRVNLTNWCVHFVTGSNAVPAGRPNVSMLKIESHFNRYSFSFSMSYNVSNHTTLEWNHFINRHVTRQLNQNNVMFGGHAQYISQSGEQWEIFGQIFLIFTTRPRFLVFFVVAKVAVSGEQ